MNIQVGDIVAFRLTSFGAKILSFILGIFEPSWRKRKQKFWHLAVVSEVMEEQNMVKLIEAIGTGAREKYYNIDYLNSVAKIYGWFDKPITRHRVEHFKKVYLGKPYDFGAYLGVIIAYLVNKYLKFSFRVVDQQYMCWELACAFARFNEKPLNENWEYPLISNIINKLEAYENTVGCPYNGNNDMEGLKR